MVCLQAVLASVAANVSLRVEQHRGGFVSRPCLFVGDAEICDAPDFLASDEAVFFLRFLFDFLLFCGYHSRGKGV